MSKIKTFFNGVWEFCKFLLFTPSWGSKRRKAQQEYEERLDAAMERYEAEVDERLRQFMAEKGITSISNHGTYTPEYIYKLWNEEVSLRQIKRAMKRVQADLVRMPSVEQQLLERPELSDSRQGEHVIRHS